MDENEFTLAVIGATMIQRSKAAPLDENAVFDGKFETGANVPFEKAVDKILPKE